VLPQCQILQAHEMAWYRDDLFLQRDLGNLEELGGFASPAFRVSAQGSLDTAHPHDHVEAYHRLFEVFEPSLRQNAKRLVVNEVGGAKPRRRTSITNADWRPFHHLKTVVPEDDRHWIGFDFQSGKSSELADAGPAGFRFRVARAVQLDATISVPEFDANQINLAQLKEALLALPVASAIAGYGLKASLYVDERDWKRELFIPVAKAYSALDVCPSPLRSWFAEHDADFNQSWICGINWLTLIGEPYLSALGGPDVLLEDLPSAIKAEVSDHAMLFQLGEWPITGETGKDDELLSLYHALGARLQPLGEGCPSVRHPRGPVFGVDSKEISLLWERRFYDGKWFEETGK
jgi:Protein of unknown function (DUF3396)